MLSIRNKNMDFLAGGNVSIDKFKDQDPWWKFLSWKSLTEPSLDSEQTRAMLIYFIMQQNHLEGSLKHSDSDSASLEWGQIICISNKFPVNVNTAGPVTTLGKLLL